MHLNYRNTLQDHAFSRKGYTGQQRASRKPKPLNFEAYAGEANHFIHEVANELGIDRDHAARITRAVLHAVRDRLRPDDAIQFAQGLPMALKGVFIDRYDISKTPVIIRNRKKFIEFVHHKAGISAAADFPDPEAVEDALRAVFYVLERNMSYGQVQHVKHALNLEILDIINGNH